MDERRLYFNSQISTFIHGLGKTLTERCFCYSGLKLKLKLYHWLKLELKDATIDFTHHFDFLSLHIDIYDERAYYSLLKLRSYRLLILS